MPEILILQNISREGPGLFGDLLRERKIPFTVLDLSQEAPPRFEDLADRPKALLVLGGPQSANDETESIRGELAFIRRSVEAGIPYLGICLGLQLLVKALGGRVLRSPVKEVGFRGPDRRFFQVELTPEGKVHPWLQGMSPNFPVFQLHGETVDFEGMTGGPATAAGAALPGALGEPEGSPPRLLGKGAYCTHQIVGVGNRALGLQFHLELTEDLLLRWAEEDPDLVGRDGKALLEDFAQVRLSCRENARKLLSHFLGAAGFR